MADQITDANFDSEVLKSPVPVLIDFWAPWCGPCRAMSPVIDDLSAEYAGRVKIVKMNVDENTRTPSQYQIRAIPTMILFKNGQVVETLTGALPKEALKQVLDTKALA